MPGFSTPVLLFVYRRPATLSRVFERIRQVRPRTLFVAIDVPSSGPDDAEHREAVRLATDVDWPCELVVDRAERPLGCTRRMVSGLDAVFAEVDRVLVLEDDIVVDPTFFGWAESMLDRYAEDPAVGHVGGRNELVRWPAAVDDHIIVRRGSLWAWGTWRDVWQRHREGPRLADPSGPGLFDEHIRHFDLSVDGPLIWDVEWTRFLMCAGLRSVVSAVNLADNIGFGPGAAHTANARDLRANFPTGSAVPLFETDDGWDHTLSADMYDEWSLLVDLMATYREPAAVARLARMSARGAVPFLDQPTRHHLEPFERAETSLRALGHLRRHGVDPERLAPLERALTDVLRADSGT